MTGGNPYQAYAEGSVFADQSLGQVVALYEGALEATRQAVHCLQTRDIWGRGKAISKGIAILSELLVSLDERDGGEIAQNLKRLYFYMQRRLIEAHSRQAAPPLLEVSQLLETMLEGWRGAASSGNVSNRPEAIGQEARSQALANLTLALAPVSDQPAEAQPYAEYFGQDVETPGSPVFSF